MRKHYIDNLRWFTVVLVVIYHVFFIYSVVVPDMGMPFSDVQYQDGIMYLLWPWFMILLFLVSGMSSRYYLENHTPKEFIKSRTTKLLVPSTIGVILFGWIQGYINMCVNNVFETLPPEMPNFVKFIIMIPSGIGPLWFIQLLWLFCLILKFITRFEKGKFYALTAKTPTALIIAFVIPLWGAANVLNMPIINVYRFGLYGFAFFLGYFVFAHDEVIDRVAKLRFVMIPLAAGLGIAYLVLHFGENYANMPLMADPLPISFAWATILALIGSFRTWFNKSTPFTEFMRRRSWGLYVFHYLALSALALFLRRHTAMPAVPCYILTFIAAFAGAFALNEIISRIPFVRWAVLGIKKKKEAKHVQG